MRERRRNLRERWAEAAVALVVAGTGGAFLAYVGALGAGAEPAVVRYGGWIGLMVCGALAFELAERAAGASAKLRAAPPLVRTAASGLLLAAMMSAVIWLGSAALFDQPLTAARLIAVVPDTAVVSAAVVLLSALARRAAAASRGERDRTDAPPALLERLPPAWRAARLIAVQAEDHYVRVHTDRGERLLLLPLSRAVVELAGVEGARVHRSWWVARDAVEAAERRDGRVVLRLAGGLRVPAARRTAPGLRRAGWF